MRFLPRSLLLVLPPRSWPKGPRRLYLSCQLRSSASYPISIASLDYCLIPIQAPFYPAFIIGRTSTNLLVSPSPPLFSTDVQPRRSPRFKCKRWSPVLLHQRTVCTLHANQPHRYLSLPVRNHPAHLPGRIHAKYNGLITKSHKRQVLVHSSCHVCLASTFPEKLEFIRNARLSHRIVFKLPAYIFTGSSETIFHASSYQHLREPRLSSRIKSL